jgi:diguanylate cyclase
MIRQPLLWLKMDKRLSPVRLFGIDISGNSNASESSNSSNVHSLEAARREELLTRIRDFFLDNQLEVTAGNLLVAHAAFSGASRRLGRKFELMRAEQRSVTQEWLDEASAAASDDAGEADLREETSALLLKLDTGLAGFSTATAHARSATGEYHSALQQTASSLSQSDAAGQMIASLTELTRTMIERTTAMEEGMRKSEEEASSLRSSLERAQRDAQMDHLTGLPNRRAFEGVLQREYREAQKEIEPLSVAFCDIDHFKRVNDTHGHETGDRVIQAIAQVLQRITNERCHVARHGGEEFVMLFRGMNTSEAHAVLDGAREQLSSRNFVNRKTDEPIGGITFSGGVADVFGYADPRAALEAADEALYRAKSSGRNQICIA